MNRLIFYSRAYLASVFLFTVSYFFFVPKAIGRIGESRMVIERRLTQAGGIVYRDEAIKQSRRRGMPYMRFYDYFPEMAEVRIYFKTDDGRKPKSSQMSEKQSAPGWDIHVLYVEGKSVLEVYARSRQAMTEYELNHILQLQAGSGYWNRVSQPSPRASNDSVESDLPSAFGHEMERSDGQVRAKKIKGNAIMLFDVDLDVRIAREKHADLQAQAPISINGF
ncbi:MAG: hypothetical protein MK120_04555 [Puniceicoccaceae bacterium]|nr:hypothetical protein [Puniceicoccaceae bacterium]